MGKQLPVVQTTTQEFKCDPYKLCEGAQCCRGNESYPSLSIGDYIRISGATGKPLTALWRDAGDVQLSDFSDLEKGEYLMTLSLLHDPCPYLTDDFRCSIYEARPLGCGSFPFLLFKYDPEQIRENYKHYACLHGIQPSREQIKFGEDVDTLMRKEAELDVRIMWSGKPRYISVPNVAVYGKLALGANEMQERRDPAGRSYRSRRLLRAIDKMNSFVMDGTLSRGINTDLYISMVQPVVFTLVEDEIAKKLSSLTPDEIAAYGETTQRWKELARRAL
ncbi:MAG: YkgJ family cysteine cluster protein [Candidatus Aenigmatarchaeota archaeon]